MCNGSQDGNRGDLPSAHSIRFPHSTVLMNGCPRSPIGWEKLGEIGSVLHENVGIKQREFIFRVDWGIECVPSCSAIRLNRRRARLTSG